MSYILEAIKKADQKRKLGSVPDVHTVHDGPPPMARRLLWPYILALGLFLNSALIIWWLHPWSAKLPVSSREGGQMVAKHAEKPPAVSPELSADQKTVTAEIHADKSAVPLEVAGQTGASADKQTAPVEKEAASLEIKTAEIGGKLSDSPAVEATSETANVNTEEIDVTDSEAESKAKVADLPAETLDSTAEHPKIVERIGGQPLPDTDYAESDLKAEQQREIDRQELAKIPYLRRMSADFRKEIPAIHISFHSYTYKPAKRLVSINGRIFREGDELQDGLKLEKITPGGVVLSYKERSFKVKI